MCIESKGVVLSRIVSAWSGLLYVSEIFEAGFRRVIKTSPDVSACSNVSSHSSSVVSSGSTHSERLVARFMAPQDQFAVVELLCAVRSANQFLIVGPSGAERAVESFDIVREYPNPFAERIHRRCGGAMYSVPVRARRSGSRRTAYARGWSRKCGRCPSRRGRRLVGKGSDGMKAC